MQAKFKAQMAAAAKRKRDYPSVAHYVGEYVVVRGLTGMVIEEFLPYGKPCLRAR